MAGANRELVEDAAIPGGETQEREPPKDVRGAIKAAFKEVGEKDNGADDDTDEKRVRADNASSVGKNGRGRETTESDNKVSKRREPEADSESEEDEADKKQPLSADESEEEEETKEVKEEPKIDPPPFYKNKGKALWDKLSAEDKQYLVNREEEVSRGFAQVSQRLKNVEEIERAIAPHAQAIQQNGYTPGQVVNQLFAWMEGLNNPRTQLDTFKKLAASFNVNLSQLVPGTESNSNTNTETDGPPSWFSEFTSAVDGEIGQLKQTLTNQQQQALNQYINNWAKDKPHYNAVRELMGQLIGSGAIPPKDGYVDLDGAYEAAIKLHPEISTQVQQEAAEKAAKEAADKAKKEAKERTEKLRKAQSAGSGLKPAASTVGAAPPGGRASQLNGAKKNQSVRDSIMAAIQEARS